MFLSLAGLVFKGDRALGGPVVHKYADEFVMWFHGREEVDIALPPTSTGRISVTTSQDGLSWAAPRTVLTENTEDWWSFDTAHVGLGDVVCDGGDWRSYKERRPLSMYYFGGPDKDTELRTLGIDKDGSVPAMDLRIGLAMSQGDISKFARIEGEFANGETLTADREPYLGWPCLVDDFMYYHYLSDRKHVVGLAKRQGSRFVKVGKIFEGENDFDARGVSRRCVRPTDDGFLMWYEGLGNDGTHSIGLAQSNDGIHWTPQPQPVFAPARDGSWDDNVVSAPYVIKLDESRLRMYYVGASSDSPMAIGAADSTDGGQTWTRVPSPYAS